MGTVEIKTLQVQKLTYDNSVSPHSNDNLSTFNIITSHYTICYFWWCPSISRSSLHTGNFWSQPVLTSKRVCQYQLYLTGWCHMNLENEIKSNWQITSQSIFTVEIALNCLVVETPSFSVYLLCCRLIGEHLLARSLVKIQFYDQRLGHASNFFLLFLGINNIS